MAISGKRGSMLVFISIIIIIVALFSILIYTHIAKNYGTGKIALKTAAARDIALILDTIYSYPYDIQIDYDYDLSDFIVEIYDNKVEIYDAEYSTPEADFTSAEYSFVPVDDNPNFVLDEPTEIVFEKKNGILIVT